MLPALTTALQPKRVGTHCQPPRKPARKLVDVQETIRIDANHDLAALSDQLAQAQPLAALLDA